MLGRGDRCSCAIFSELSFQLNRGLFPCTDSRFSSFLSCSIEVLEASNNPAMNNTLSSSLLSSLTKLSEYPTLQRQRYHSDKLSSPRVMVRCSLFWTILTIDLASSFAKCTDGILLLVVVPLLPFIPLCPCHSQESWTWRARVFQGLFQRRLAYLRLSVSWTDRYSYLLLSPTCVLFVPQPSYTTYCFD